MNKIKYVSVAEMISIEREATTLGLSYDQMMENAGRGLAEVVSDHYNNLKGQLIVGLVGSGNNGGDTLVALAYLASWGWKVCAYIVRDRNPDDPLMIKMLEAGGEIIHITGDSEFHELDRLVRSAGIIMDGVLGTGIKLPLRGSVVDVLSFVKGVLASLHEPPLIVAVDCPSGIDCDTGEAAPECLVADMTVTMAAYKQGLLRFPAYKFAGEIVLVGIGLSRGNKSWVSIKREVATQSQVVDLLPPRPPDAHKGTFGTALIIAGSLNYTGAVLLAGEAAYRSGAGLVTLGVSTPLHSLLAGELPEATWLLLPHEHGAIAEDAADTIVSSLGRTSAILFGPGFGQAPATQRFVGRLLTEFNAIIDSRGVSDEYRLPSFTIDADGLKLMAQFPGWADLLPAPAVLTPHPGEMAILTGRSLLDIQSNRVEIAETYAKQWGHVVVLKGAFTVVAAPNGRTTVIPVASAALARAGTGDVLAGLIVGLRAQGMDAYSASIAGAWIHAQGGLRAQELLGNSACVLAGDVLHGAVKVLGQILA